MSGALPPPVRVEPASVGARLPVRVTPGARRTRLLGVHGDALKVSVQAPPERGRANRELCTYLASQLGLRRGAVTVATGETSRDKTIEIEGLTPELLISRLRDLLAS